MSEFAAMTGFASGAVGGLCNVVVGHPIDLVKVRVQTVQPPLRTGGGAAAAAVMATNNINTFGLLRSIFAAEGVTGLYRGVSAPLVAVVPAYAVTFWSFDTAKHFLLKHSAPDRNQLTIGQTAWAGGYAGLMVSFVLGPSERIKCLMQVEQHNNKQQSFFGCARRVYREGGFRSLFRGFGVTVMRDVPGNVAYFSVYEYARRALMKAEGTSTPSLGSAFLAGGIAGVANWIVAIPFDVVKSRFQTAPPGQYENLMDVCRQLMREEGAAALFRGLSPALIRAFPANAACLGGVETARSLIGSL